MDHSKCIFLFLLAAFMTGCVPRSNDPIREVRNVEADAALDYLDNALKGDPDNSRSWFKKAVIHKEEGASGEALQAINRAIQIEYADPEFFLLKGEILTDLDRPDRAIVFLTRAEAAGERNGKLYTFLARNYLKLGKPDEARKAVDRLLKIDKSDISHMLAGKAYAELGDSLLAVTEFEKAILLNPKNVEAYIGLADIYESGAHFSKAETNLDIALELDKSNTDLMRRKAQLLRQRGSYDSAIFMYRRVADQAPDEVSWYNVAQVYYRAGRYDSARKFVDRSLLARQDYPDALLLKARTLDRLRNYSEAMEVYTQIIEADSTDNLARTELDKLRRKVSYLQRLEQQRRAADALQNNLPPSLDRKEIENR